MDDSTLDYVGTLLACGMENSDNPDEDVAAYFALVVCSSNPAATKKSAEELTKAYGLLPDTSDVGLEEFTTKSGHTLWIDRYSDEDGGALVYGNPTSEQQAGIDAMFEGLDDLLAQCEVVKPQPKTATGKVVFSTVDLDGNPVDSSVFANVEYTMINIWGSFCAPCIEEMDDLMKMDVEMDNVQIITILGGAQNVEDDTAEDAREIVEQLNSTLPVYLINEEIEALLPYNGVFPTSFMLDREGNPLGIACVGAVGSEKYQKWIQNCIKAQ